MSALTPLPWVATGHSVDRLWGENGSVCTCRHPMDAEHIAFCVNAHDALMAALRTIVAETTPDFHAYDIASSALARYEVAR